MDSEEANILENEKYDNYPIIKLFKSKNIGNIQRELLHFEFIISEKNKEFFEKLVQELKNMEISSNINYYNNKITMMEDLAMLISDTNEKSNIYLISTLFEFIEKIVVLSQMTGTYLYMYNRNTFDLIPNLPFDILESAEDNLREKYRTPEIRALIRKLKYYHQVNKRKKIIEQKLSERPNYDVSNGIYKRNIFYHSDNSLWGDIDHIYEIKSKEVVKDLEFIYSKLNEKIESIHMLNYIFSYKENKIYREILGIQKNEIFGKYYLESGIQYFKIVVKRNEKMKEIINKIEKYKEL